MANENLGPAERIIQTLLTHADHMFHGRPGYVVQAPTSVTGVDWQPVTHKVEEGKKVVYKLTKVGKKSIQTRIGVMDETTRAIAEGRRFIGNYRSAGLFPEVATWMYQQVAEVWKLDNEFAAKWASYAWKQDHRDLKVILAAFMLCQSRKGDPVIDAGKIAFHDEDYRDVGEAMLLLHEKGKDLNPKLLLRLHDLLSLPGIAEVNRQLGFGKSARRPFYGRWEKAVTKWLQYREQNPKLLEGLVKAGFKTTVMELARRVGYKPASPKFFDALRWKQVQAKDGRRDMAIGAAVKAAESWEGFTETQICERIVQSKPDWKRIVGLLPKGGLTRAIVAAAIEAGSFSNKDLIIATPTLEELGLLQVQDIRERWEKALKTAEDMRAANIATKVKSKVIEEKLQEAADVAVQKAAEEVMKGMRIYFMVDISGSMENAIAEAKVYLAKFLQAFPPDRLHVSVFNTSGREVTIKHPTAAGVENAFRGIAAGGGTDYGAGVAMLSKYKPAADEDVLFFFVGDEEANVFTTAVRRSGLNPLAFGFLKVRNAPNYQAVRGTAQELGIPCFMVDPKMFEDPYAIPRVIRNMIAATPVGVAPNRVVAAPRVTLVEQILQTTLLQKPAWAA